jgi:hypothetical protein
VICSQETVGLRRFLAQEEQTYVLYSAEPDDLHEDVHVSAESISRPDVTLHCGCHS